MFLEKTESEKKMTPKYKNSGVFGLPEFQCWNENDGFSEQKLSKTKNISESTLVE